jgi:hypothetical protein
VCLGLGGRRKHTLQDNPTLQARILAARGSSNTLGVSNTFGEARPSLGRRRGPRVSALKDNVITSPARGLGRSIPASDPLTDDPARLRPTRSSHRANSASVRADTATPGLSSSKSGRGVPLTEQEKPPATRLTEPRDSYASGIRIPHSSPLRGATHAW